MSSGKSSEVSQLKRYLPQIIAVSVKNVLLLVYGLSMGMPTMLIPNLAGDVPGESIVLNEDGISWIGSLNYLSVPLGCLVSGAFTRPYGRIRSMQVICVLFFGSFLLYHFSTQAWQVLLALFLTGFSGGLLEAPTLIYTVEITEPSLRGALSSTSTLGIVIGIIISFVLGAAFPWRTMALINGCIPLVGLVMLIFIPESPYWLITQNKLEQARGNLAWLRGWTVKANIEQEFLGLVKAFEQEPKGMPLTKTLKLYLKSTFIRPFLLINFTFVLAHFGTTQINVYAVKIFQVLQVPIDSYYATILIGAVELLGCVLLMLLVRYSGKRKLIFISQMGAFVCFLLVGIYAYKLGIEDFDSTNIENPDVARYSWAPLIAIASIGFFSYLMTYTLPWILMGELYPNELRDAASGLSAGTGYIIGFLSNKTFLNLVSVATLAGVFWIYSAVALIGLIAIYFLLPETEGKSLNEITDHYAGTSKLNNKIERRCVKRDIIGDGVENKGFENYGECDLNVRL